MKKEDARKKFGNDVFYKLTDVTYGNILAVTNSEDFVKEQKKYWNNSFDFQELDTMKVEEIDFDTAWDLVRNDDLIIRRFYEHE